MQPAPQWTQFPRYPATAGTILLAVIATIWVWTTGSTETLCENALIAHGQVWRLVTSALPHGSIIHLMFNLYWCWVFGTLVERRFGHVATLGIIVLLAAGSGAAEYAVLDGGIGLSGVVYGLFGMLWVLQRRDPRLADALDHRIVVLFVGWFFFCIVTTVAGVLPIANVAHGMGALLGAALGRALSAKTRRAVAFAAPILIAAICILGSTVLRPWTNLSSYAGADEARRGYDALVANRNDEAVNWCRAAIRYRPYRGGYWYNLGIALGRTGHTEESEEAYDKARGLDPSLFQSKAPDSGRVEADGTQPPAAGGTAEYDSAPDDPFRTRKPTTAPSATGH